MGLDLIPLGRAKPGHEAEWSALMEKIYGEQAREELPEDTARRNEISIMPYEIVGAPRVGFDAAADAWALEQRPPSNPISDDAQLKQLHGYYVLQLLENCDGVPRYSHGEMYEGVDLTSLRGSILEFCEWATGKELLERAWTSVMRPEQAVEYGKALFAVADRVESGLIVPPPAGNGDKAWWQFWKKAGTSPQKAPAEVAEILRLAGRWYIYWGERGHPIWAYF